MPDDGVVKLTDEQVAELGHSDPTKIDDATLAIMAEKSGDSVEHMKKILGLYGDDPVKKSTDDGDGGTGDDDVLLAGKYKTEEDLDKGIQSLVDKYGKEKAYKMLEASMGSGDGSIDDAAAAAKANADANDALTGDDAATMKAAVDTAEAAVVTAEAAAKLAAEGDNAEAKTAADQAVVDAKAIAAEATAAATETGDSGQIDFADFYDEFADKGELSTESYKKLSDAGYDKDLVDGYIQGQEARGILFTNDVHALAGGETEFDAMVEWGSENLTEPEKVRFNEAVNSGNIDSAKLVLDALKGRYASKEGTFQRKRVESSDNIDGSNPGGYASAAEMSVAMRDPRYRSDAAYVKMVQEKVKNSTFM